MSDDGDKIVDLRAHRLNRAWEQDPFTEGERRAPEPEPMPYYRWESFVAEERDDGSALITVMCDSSGYVFADGFTNLASAEWTAAVLNAALAAARSAAGESR